MGPGHLSRALTLASIGALAVDATAAQGATSAERALAEQHRATVVSERVLRFLRHFDAADSDRRRAVLDALIAARPTAAGSGWTPTLDVLRRVESLVADATGGTALPDSAVGLDTLAGALDLVAVPGAFECATEGLGDALTVRVRRIYQVAVPADFVLELRWRSNDGVDVRARREPISPAAVTEAGFEMYVRSPLSGPAPWRLYGVVGDAASSDAVGGLAEIRVDAVERLAERAQAVLARDVSAQPGLAHLAWCLRQLLASGARASASLGAGEMIGAMEAWSDAGPPPGVPLPLESMFVDRSGASHWSWTYGPASEPKAAVVLTASSFEAADHNLAGILGERWTDFAERTQTQLFSLHVSSDLRAVAGELERVRSWVDGRPLYVVARGDALARVELALKAAPKELLDGVVLSGVSEGVDPRRLLPQFTRLVVAPGAAAFPAADGYQGVDGQALSIVNDLELPLHVERWLAALRMASPGGAGK